MTKITVLHVLGRWMERCIELRLDYKHDVQLNVDTCCWLHGFHNDISRGVTFYTEENISSSNLDNSKK